MSREKFEAWGMSDVDLRITLESETYAGIAWMAWQAATASMQAERDQLAAECAALKESRQRLGQFIHEELEADYPLNMHIETPATDRFLAEQMAQGVEMLATLAGNECQRHKSVNDRAGVRKWKSIVILCSDFAAQLRNEVKV